MLDDAFIATTAISSFNNAALLTPWFFSAGVLALPLFLLVYLYGRDFVSRFGWNNQNVEPNTGFWVSAFLTLWMLLLGGNYAVIRDSISLLPLGLSAVLFLLMIVVSNYLVRFKYLEKLRSSTLKLGFLSIVLLSVVFSGMMTWWSILLQISAVICGVIIGCRLKTDCSWNSLITLILGLMLVLILMQPEYFRFGQLGNLTIIHLLGIMFVGFFVVTTLVLKYVKARSRIHQNAFIKLKWLLRIIVLLSVLLFVSTESVPVFIGLLISVGLLEMLSVYHGAKLPDYMSKQSLAMLIISFGLIVISPVISAIGIVYLTFISNKIKAQDFLRLL